MSPTVLLTGATGFVGRQVLRSLGDHGLPIRAIVREGKEALVIGSRNLERVITTKDLFAEKSEWWAEACAGIDTIIHVAWYAESGKYLQSENLDCLVGTLEMAQGAVDACVRRVVGIGTCFEYDLTAGDLSIETSLRPTTPYADAKAKAFRALSIIFCSTKLSLLGVDCSTCTAKAKICGDWFLTFDPNFRQANSPNSQVEIRFETF